MARASGRAEREQAIEMIRHVRRRHWIHPRTLGADKGYDDGKFFKRLEEEFGVVPHVPVRRGKIKSQSEAGEARRRAKRRVHKGSLSQWQSDSPRSTVSR